MQTAEQQRCLIYANRRLIHEHETRMDRVDNAPIRLVVLRNEVCGRIEILLLNLVG